MARGIVSELLSRKFSGPPPVSFHEFIQRERETEQSETPLTVEEIIKTLRTSESKTRLEGAIASGSDLALEADDQFLEKVKELITIVQETRAVMGLAPWTKNHLIVFINELAYTKYLHRNHLRHNGDSYFYSHLLGAIQNSIRHGFTGIVSLLSLLKHDDVEDLEKEGVTSDKILCVPLYDDLLEYDRAQPRRYPEMQVQIRTNVVAASKEERDTQKATADATFKKILQAMRKRLDIVLIRLFEQLHNGQTLDGHKKPERAKSIAKEQWAIQGAFARLLEMEDLRSEFQHIILKYLNPSFVADFEVATQRQHQKKFEIRKAPDRTTNWEKILQVFAPENGFDSACIEDIELIPRPVSEFIDQFSSEVSPDMLDFSKLDIDHCDLWEIVVYARHEEDIARIRGYILENLKGKGSAVLTRPDSFNREIIVLKKADKLEIPLRFLLTSRRQEIRSRRGVLADRGKETPPELLEQIDALLSIAGDDGEGSIAAAEKGFLRAKFKVSAPNGREIELQKGSTVLDFARHIHGEFLSPNITCTIWDIDEFGERTHERQIGIHEALPPNVVVRLKKTKEDSLETDAALIEFCQEGETKREIRRRIRKLATSEELSLLAMGQKYISRISRIFSIPTKVIEEASTHQKYIKRIFAYRSNSRGIAKNIPLTESDQLLLFQEMIGLGEIGILDILSEQETFVSTCSWKLEIPNMPNSPGKFHEFTHLLNFDRKINMQGHHSTALSDGTSQVSCVVNYDPTQVTPYDFVRLILQLNQSGFQTILSAYI